MNNMVDKHQLSELERQQIDSDIKKDLVEHLYKSVPGGMIGGWIGSISFFIVFYNAVKFKPLLVWFSVYLVALIATIVLYFLYQRRKELLSISRWGSLLAVCLAIYSLLWGSIFFFNPSDALHQLILLAIIFMAAASFSMATVGMFWWSVVVITLILAPTGVAWIFTGEDVAYRIASMFILVYYLFLLALNYRSATWLKDSLRLKIENSYYTHQANHDILTGLPNQRLLMQTMENNIDLKSNFAVVCFSINRMDMFSSSVGYYTSDLIVQTVANRLNSLAAHTMRNQAEEYFVSHPRTDAFVVLINRINLDNLDKLIKQFFDALIVPFQIENREAKLTGSIGVSLYPNDGDDSQTLLSNGYAAMFQAKQKGGNQLVYYKREINEKTPYLLDLENDLSYALERREFRVFYQPIVDLSNGKIAGMEALIRWKHPKRGWIQPMDFIPLAEENGLIVPIGEWVLTQAAHQTAQWNKLGYDLLHLRIAVNLSPKQLRQANFLEMIKEVLKKTGLNPDWLDLELLESAVLDETLSPLIKEITKLGVTLSIDDFGTGYSGLSYLKFFSIDRIKIDKSFIQDVDTNVESATIVSAMLAMGKELGIKTLAEGVENEEQLKFLLEKGCQYAQGFYFSKPIPATEFGELIKNNGSYEVVSFKLKALQKKSKE